MQLRRKQGILTIKTFIKEDFLVTKLFWQKKDFNGGKLNRESSFFFGRNQTPQSLLTSWERGGGMTHFPRFAENVELVAAKL